jgi:hypothetical protein
LGKLFAEKSAQTPYMVLCWNLNMLDKVKPLFGVALIGIVWITVLVLIAIIGNWFILLISPRILDIGCGVIVLFLVGLYVFQKTWVEIKTNGHINAFRWFGLLIATLLFIGFYRLINSLDTMQQYGCGFVLFVLVLGMISSLSPPPNIIGDDEDDYHASR